MRRLNFFLGAVVISLAGCGIPPVNTKTISQTPAAAAQLAVAEKAVRSCAKLPNSSAVVKSLRQNGFTVATTEEVTRNGTKVARYKVTTTDPAVLVNYSGTKCVVGLVNMTPQQSYQLVQPWVKAFSAKSNASVGDGLSDHVVGAWRSFTDTRRVYIAAYKTWPSATYDDGVFPEVPGAAVKVNYVGNRADNTDGPSYAYTLNDDGTIATLTKVPAKE